MGQKVASVIAEVGVDSSKFTAGANNLGNAANKAVNEMGGFGKGLNDISKGLFGIDAASLAGVGGIILVAKTLVDATKETQEYNLAMVDMARKMGTTTEEASRLVQVGDDVRLSQEQISDAMTFAIRNGVEPNIEGLAKLADEYNSLSTPVEKGQLLLKNFGRSGMEMGKLMEKGGDGIREMSAAIEDNMIVTKEAAEQSQRFYDAQDKLGDQWTGMKMQIGNQLIPAVSRLMDIQSQYNKVMDDNTQGIAHVIPLWGVVAAVVKSFSGDTEEASASTQNLAGSLDVAGQSARNAAVDFEMTDEQLKDLSNTNQTMIDMVEKFTDITKLSAEEQVKATHKVVLGYLEQQMAVGGLNEKETDFLLRKGVEWGIYSQKAVSSMRAAMREADNLARSVNNIPGNKSITIDTFYNTYYSTVGHEYNGRWGGGYANGADFIVPPGYNNDSYPMRVQSGEHVTVTPAGQTPDKKQEFDYNRMARTLRDVLLQVGR